MRRILKLLISSTIIAVILLLTSVTLLNMLVNVGADYNRITIVIDAGHGGRDGGSVGKNGTIEKDLNLEYANELSKKLKKAGYKIVMTRETDMGLYNPLDKNKKSSDMNKRMMIIKKANPNLVISLHMNSFNDSSVKGYQIFHKIDDPASENIATIMSTNIAKDCNVNYKNSKPGDFYMLNCSYYTSVLIECGYLSNIEDEIKLKSKEYINLFTNSLLKSINFYFSKNNLI